MDDLERICLEEKENKVMKNIEKKNGKYVIRKKK